MIVYGIVVGSYFYILAIEVRNMTNDAKLLKRTI